jgi:hypothetical protein
MGKKGGQRGIGKKKKEKREIESKQGIFCIKRRTVRMLVPPRQAFHAKGEEKVAHPSISQWTKKTAEDKSNHCSLQPW